MNFIFFSFAKSFSAFYRAAHRCSCCNSRVILIPFNRFTAVSGVPRQYVSATGDEQISFNTQSAFEYKPTKD